MDFLFFKSVQLNFTIGQNNKVENISIKILDVSDKKIVLYVDGVINNKIDENQIIMTLRKYPDIRKISYTRGGL